MSHSLSSTPQLSSPHPTANGAPGAPLNKASRPPQDTPRTQAAPLRGDKPLPPTPRPTKVRFAEETVPLFAPHRSNRSRHEGISTSKGSSRLKPKVKHSNSHELPSMCFPRPYWQPDYRRSAPRDRMDSLLPLPLLFLFLPT